MGIGDLTLNVMSLGGIALGMGVLLDNAIVMLENIYRRRDEGWSRRRGGRARRRGRGDEPDRRATVTNLASVVPFLLITGLSALVFRELILTISISHLASLPVALTLVPMLAAQLGKIRFTSGLEHFGPLRRVRSRLRSDGRALPQVSATRSWSAGRWVLLAGVAGLGVWAYSSRERSTRVPAAGGRWHRHGQHCACRRARRLTSQPGHTRSRRDDRARCPACARLHQRRRSVAAATWTSCSSPPRARHDVGPVGAGAAAAGGRRGFAGVARVRRPPRIRGLRTSSSGGHRRLGGDLGDQLEQLDEIGQELSRRLRGIPGLENLQVQADESRAELAIALDRERARKLGPRRRGGRPDRAHGARRHDRDTYTQGNFEYDVRVLFPSTGSPARPSIGEAMLFPGGRGTAPVFLRDVADVRPASGPGERSTARTRTACSRLSGDVITEVASISEVVDSVRARCPRSRCPTATASSSAVS